MTFPLAPPIEPMLAELQESLPQGEGWLYEPKWDGFRGLVYRDGDLLHIQSRKNQPLERYFPELLEPLKTTLPARYVIDGEIIVAGPGGLDFDALQQRIHPAASRVARLAKETPAAFVAFDLLALEDQDLRALPLRERQTRLRAALQPSPQVFLTPQTRSPEQARMWFERFEGAGLDGVIAKQENLTYQPGERVMVKLKHLRTIDCVVGGYREHKNGGIGTLLLGLYDDGGVLHHIGHTSTFSAKERRELVEKLKPLEGGTSFGEGRTPGAPSRWSQGKELSWTPLRPELVCEVSFDYMQGDRFRHGLRFLRWRLDKAPRDCTQRQVQRPANFSLADVIAATPQA